MRPRTIVGVALAAALVVFAAVQDRVTAAGARQYVQMQREALAAGTSGIRVEEVMAPAVERSVRLGLAWGGAVLAAGAGIAAASRTKRGHRE